MPSKCIFPWCLQSLLLHPAPDFASNARQHLCLASTPLLCFLLWFSAPQHGFSSAGHTPTSSPPTTRRDPADESSHFFGKLKTALKQKSPVFSRKPASLNSETTNRSLPEKPLEGSASIHAMERKLQGVAVGQSASPTPPARTLSRGQTSADASSRNKPLSASLPPRCSAVSAKGGLCNPSDIIHACLKPVEFQSECISLPVRDTHHSNKCLQ